LLERLLNDFDARVASGRRCGAEEPVFWHTRALHQGGPFSGIRNPHAVVPAPLLWIGLASNDAMIAVVSFDGIAAVSDADGNVTEALSCRTSEQHCAGCLKGRVQRNDQAVFSRIVDPVACIGVTASRLPWQAAEKDALSARLKDDPGDEFGAIPGPLECGLQESGPRAQAILLADMFSRQCNDIIAECHAVLPSREDILR